MLRKLTLTFMTLALIFYSAWEREREHTRTHTWIQKKTDTSRQVRDCPRNSLYNWLWWNPLFLEGKKEKKRVSKQYVNKIASLAFCLVYTTEAFYERTNQLTCTMAYRNTLLPFDLYTFNLNSLRSESQNKN